MKKYKVDWFAFSFDLTNSGQIIDEELINLLGYDLSDFEETVGGKYFYNSGLTVGGYVNLYYDDPSKKISGNKKNARTMTVVFTGQGSTDLSSRWNDDWTELLRVIYAYGWLHSRTVEEITKNEWQRLLPCLEVLELEEVVKIEELNDLVRVKKNAVKITRIDLALDDFDETVKFKNIEKKLDNGHYRSSKKSYNVLKQSNSKGDILGETIYIGQARGDSGSRGNVYARFYDKLAQYKEKNQLFPTEVRQHWALKGKESWQRYEISYSKMYARRVVEQLVVGESVDKVFKTSLRNLLEILTPKGGDKNKSRWYKTKWWEEFLKFDEKMNFGKSERDVMLSDLLDWLRVAVLPSIALLEEIGEVKGFDIYEELRLAEKEVTASKKNLRLLRNAKKLDNLDIQSLLQKFKGVSDGD